MTGGVFRAFPALLFAAALVSIAAPSALAFSPPARPTASPTPGGLTATDPGLILVVVVIPVVLVALIWLGYIFWLIFHEGENVGSGDPVPRDKDDRRPPDGPTGRL